MLPPFGNLVEIVTGRDRRASHQQQLLLQRVHHPPGFAARGQHEWTRSRRFRQDPWRVENTSSKRSPNQASNASISAWVSGTSLGQSSVTVQVVLSSAPAGPRDGSAGSTP